MYNYIPIPSNMRDYPQIVELRINEGAAGYGIYIMVLQALRDAISFSIGDNPKRLAYIFNEPDVSLVDRVLHNYGLFDTNNDGLLFSQWLNEALESYQDKKIKLQEAGRRGAAKRWAAAQKVNGQAIATPLLDNGQAIAYNTTQYNITEYNKTSPAETEEEDWRVICRSPGLKVDDELVSAIAATQPAGHAPGYLADVCRRYGIGQNVLDYLNRVTDNGNLENSRYKAFVSLVKRIEAEKYRPEYPANFFCSKI